MGTQFAALSFVLAALLIVVDVAIYYPFLKVYDDQIYAEELAGTTNDSLKEKVAANFNTAKADAILEKAGAVETKEITEQTNVLVLCAGGGTSGLLANALTKAAKEYGAPVTAAAGSYGAHREILPQYQLVILAPQVASNYEDMKAETDKLGIKLISCKVACISGFWEKNSTSVTLDELDDELPQATKTLAKATVVAALSNDVNFICSSYCLWNIYWTL